jgi:YgiT-type zinc finger domain-containing protein
MIGKAENKLCPVCGGKLHSGVATLPFIFDDNIVVVVKGVPAEICGDCYEPFMAGQVTDQVMALLNQLRLLRSEVSVISYPEYEVA